MTRRFISMGRTKIASITGSRSSSRARSRRPIAYFSAFSRSASGAGSLRRARLRRPHRRAGPDALQPLLHHRPQVLPRPGHHPARHRHRLGRRPGRDLRPGSRHGGGAALARELRDGMSGELDPPRRRRPPEPVIARPEPVRGLRRAPARQPAPLTPKDAHEQTRLDEAQSPRTSTRSPRSCSRARGLDRSSTPCRSRSRVLLESGDGRISRCRTTASSTRTRWSGSSTRSSTRTGSSFCTWPARSSTRRPTGSGDAGQWQGRYASPQGAAAMSAQEILSQLDAAQVAMKPPESVAWTRAYLAGGHDRGRLVGTLALSALKHGNDPHNQEIALCLYDDYRRNPHGTASSSCSRAPSTPRAPEVRRHAGAVSPLPRSPRPHRGLERREGPICKVRALGSRLNVARFTLAETSVSARLAAGYGSPIVSTPRRLPSGPPRIWTFRSRLQVF